MSVLEPEWRARRWQERAAAETRPTPHDGDAARRASGQPAGVRTTGRGG